MRLDECMSRDIQPFDVIPIESSWLILKHFTLFRQPPIIPTNRGGVLIKKRVQNWPLDLRWNFCLSKGFLKEPKIWTTLRGPNISQLAKATSSWTSKVPVLGGYVRSQEGSYWNSKHWNTSNWAIEYLEWLMAGPVEPNKLLDLDRKTSQFSGNKICMADLDHDWMLCPLLFPLKWFHGTILLKHWWKMNKINQPWKDWICDSPHLGGLS